MSCTLLRDSGRNTGWAKALEWENKVTKAQSKSSQLTASAALDILNEANVNLRRSTRKLQHVKNDDYHRGIRTRGGVDGYRHREGALKKVVPCIKRLQHQGLTCKLLEDGVTSHKSWIANDILLIRRWRSWISQGIHQTSTPLSMLGR